VGEFGTLQPAGRALAVHAGIRALVSTPQWAVPAALGQLPGLPGMQAPGVSENLRGSDIAEVHSSRRDPNQRTGAECGHAAAADADEYRGRRGIEALRRKEAIYSPWSNRASRDYITNRPYGEPPRPNSPRASTVDPQHHSTWREADAALSLPNVRAGADSRRRRGVHDASSRNREREPALAEPPSTGAKCCGWVVFPP